VVAIKAQRLETGDKGVLLNAVLVIRNGKIVAVGKDVKIPLGAKIVQAQTIMPGIVGVYSQIGLSPAAPGFGQPRAVSTPHYRVMDELYPFDDNYARLLRAGVTTLALVPGGRGINGQGAIVRLAAESPEQMALVPSGLLAVNFAANTQTIDLIRSTLESARPAPPPTAPAVPAATPPSPMPMPRPKEGDEDDMQRRQRRTGPGGGGPAPAAATAPPDVRREPLVRAVQGTIPTFVTCPDSAATLYALQVFQAFDTLKPVYVLNAGCFRIAETLGQKKASVVLDADIAFEPLTRNRLNVPAILTKAGAKVACRPPGDDVNGYDALRFKMGELIKNGLDRDVALKAITVTPAEMLSIADRVGSLEVGRDGNVILLDGDPFDPLTRVRQVLLEGKVVYDGP
jgi:hypothetical protein